MIQFKLFFESVLTGAATTEKLWKFIVDNPGKSAKELATLLGANDRDSIDYLCMRLTQILKSGWLKRIKEGHFYKYYPNDKVPDKFPPERKITSKLLNKLVADNPGKTAQELANILNLPSSTNLAISLLREIRSGKLKREPKENGNRTIGTWIYYINSSGVPLPVTINSKPVDLPTRPFNHPQGTFRNTDIITAEHVMKIIAENPGKTLVELAKIMNISNNKASGRLYDITKSGWIQRRKEKGQAHLKQVWRYYPVVHSPLTEAKKYPASVIICLDDYNEHSLLADATTNEINYEDQTNLTGAIKLTKGIYFVPETDDYRIMIIVTKENMKAYYNAELVNTGDLNIVDIGIPNAFLNAPLGEWPTIAHVLNSYTSPKDRKSATDILDSLSD